MSDLTKAIPGLEAFLEGDVNIETNVEVPTADEVAEAAVQADVDATEEAEVAAEGAEVVAETEETATQAEMIAAQFDEMFAMREHIAKFGVDRSFLSLCNRGNVLGKALGIEMPACESFDAVGSPTSALSQACMEAFSLSGMWESVKKFVKKIWERIVELFGRCVLWFKTVFRSQKEKFEKIQELRKDRVMKTAEEAGDREVVIAGGLVASFAAELGKQVDNFVKLFNTDLDRETFELADGEFKNIERHVKASFAATTKITITEAESKMKQLAAAIADDVKSDKTPVEQAKEAAKARAKKADAAIRAAEDKLKKADEAGKEAAKEELKKVKEVAKYSSKAANRLVTTANWEMKMTAMRIRDLGRLTLAFMKKPGETVKKEEKKETK